ncbi:ubiquitin family protein [Dorcoceras hygrometricum]|uniref:Ubiquitin family protein n=1 Tax=Dorcoceras hygrometricum TaxID=472368 RepID=A0A2Z7AEJ4_9LAMI|nr:ubiquitin family protein [Dorcoceras hygrometricum]
MKVVAEILTGGLFYVEVEEEATAKELKEKIADQENLPINRLILMLDAEQRDFMNKDDISLKEYGVQDGSHVYIFFEPLPHDSSTSPPIQDPFSDESADTSGESSSETDPTIYLKDSPASTDSLEAPSSPAKDPPEKKDG